MQQRFQPRMPRHKAKLGWENMSKFLLIAALAACAALSSGCATEESASFTPPAPTPVTRWESEYRTGSRLPVRDHRPSATTQPVYQFDAVEYERERPPMGDHRN
jgi:hypothetical protein